MATMTDTSKLKVGQQIRALRKAKAISTAEFARRIKRSAGFVNNLEHERTEVSLQLLDTIATALGVPVSWFFQGLDPQTPDEVGVVVRKGYHRSLKLENHGVHEELLSPQINPDFQLVRTTFAPGASTGPSALESKADMTVYMVEGELDITIDQRCFQLAEGDSIQIPRHSLRRCVNNGNTPSVSIWGIYPAYY